MDPLPSGWGDHRIHYNTDSESDQEDLGAHKATYGCIMRLGAPNFEIQAATPDELAQEDNDASDRAPPSTRSHSPIRGDDHSCQGDTSSV